MDEVHASPSNIIITSIGQQHYPCMIFSHHIFCIYNGLNSSTIIHFSLIIDIEEGPYESCMLLGFKEASKEFSLNYVVK
jgi:hypothetical protein